MRKRWTKRKEKRVIQHLISSYTTIISLFPLWKPTRSINQGKTKESWKRTRVEKKRKEKQQQCMSQAVIARESHFTSGTSFLPPAAALTPQSLTPQPQTRHNTPLLFFTFTTLNYHILTGNSPGRYQDATNSYTAMNRKRKTSKSGYEWVPGLVMLGVRRTQPSADRMITFSWRWILLFLHYLMDSGSLGMAAGFWRAKQSVYLRFNIRSWRNIVGSPVEESFTRVLASSHP